eukprot:2284402-Amphidinium_carterae.1
MLAEQQSKIKHCSGQLPMPVGTDFPNVKSRIGVFETKVISRRNAIPSLTPEPKFDARKNYFSGTVLVCRTIDGVGRILRAECMSAGELRMSLYVCRDTAYPPNDKSNTPDINLFWGETFEITHYLINHLIHQNNKERK